MRPAAVTVVAAVACGLLTAVARGQLNVASPWDKTVLRLRDGDAAAGAEYVPDNNLAFRVRVWADTAYVAVPRFRAGVPATLCATPVTGDGGPLRPYPSAGLQTPGNCIGVQNAVAIELDHLGRLWTLDVGRATPGGGGGGGGNGTASAAVNACDPKLFVVDTGTGRVVRSAVMPPGVYDAAGGRSVLSGLAIDLKTLTAVVADLRPDDPAFVVYDFPTGVYRRFRCAALVTNGTSGVERKNGHPDDNRDSDDDRDSNRDSDDDDDDDYDEAVLAASPIDDQLYFTAVRLRAVYAIPLSVFAAPPLYGRDVGHYASARGPVDGTATAAVMDAAGTLYVAVRPGHKVMAWDTLRRGFGAAEPAVREVRLAWVSGLALDARGYLWIVTSAFREFRRAGAAANARIFRRYCGTTAPFALRQAAANQTAAAAAEDDAAAGRGRDMAAAAAVAVAVDAGPAALVCCTAAAALLVRVACKT